MPFTSGVVYLKNKKNDMIHPAMVTGEYSEQLSKNWINLGEGLTGYSIAFNQQVVNTDPGLDFQNLTYMERPQQLVNAMIFPRKAKDAVLGLPRLGASLGDATGPARVRIAVRRACGHPK